MRATYTAPPESAVSAYGAVVQDQISLRKLLVITYAASNPIGHVVAYCAAIQGQAAPRIIVYASPSGASPEITGEVATDCAIVESHKT